MSPSPWRLVSVASIAFLLQVAVWSQDPHFTNLESPQVKPIAIAQIGSGASQRDVILICNTPDNSVEIYNAFAPHQLLQRVPVGIAPVSVRWLPQLDRFYTCNFDGDSVSVVRLELLPSPSGTIFHAALEKTSFVGDEPSDISFDPTGALGFVTLSGRSSGILIDPLTLAPIGGETVLEAVHQSDPNIPLALKAPRQTAWTTTNRIYALNHMGENPNISLPTPTYDMDLWYLDNTMSPNMNYLSGLGSTNHAFAQTSDGLLMVVVGTSARNHSAAGEANVAALPFGFVESRFWIVDTPAGAAPSVRPEAPPGVLPVPPVINLQGRNLNRNYSALSPTPVAPSRALSQPTDVVLLESQPGVIDQIVITAFHSDKIALFQPSASAFGGYVERQISLPVLNPAQGYSTSGPRGLAYSGLTGLLYVACRLDNSLRVIDPVTATVTASIQLNNDPTPRGIRVGRQFLYNATLSSGSGFVSCASCHIDARTDGLPWDLGEMTAGPLMPPGILGSFFSGGFPSGWPSEKGPLVTQTLQGLVNYPVSGKSQDLFTNAPYHWRGDKGRFHDFNGAFVNLLGRATQLTAREMDTYTNFINTVRHPSNPEQALDRRVPGSIDLTAPDDWQLSTGTKRGIQIFHNTGMDAGRSCVDCHALPEGSDNTLTEAFPVAMTGGGTQAHPFESAALRNLVGREGILHRAPGIQAPAWFVANNGLFHNGAFQTLSINTFTDFFFSAVSPGTTPLQMEQTRDDIIAFVRQFDWGIAPTAGIPYTLDPATPGSTAVAFNVARDQVEEANIGLAVIVRSGTTLRGFWYDQTASPPGYREEGTTSVFTEAAIIAMASLPDTVVVLQATTLGNERRVASPTGQATLLVGSAPSSIAPMPMAPMTYYTDVPLFVNLLHITGTTVTINPITSVWGLRTLQLSVLGNFGVNTLHHEPPRRFRVSGKSIRPGAKLLIGMSTSTPGGGAVQKIEVDIFPTRYLDANQLTIWESEQELDPMMTFALLNGGLFAPDVQNVIDRQTTTPSLQPLLWNSFTFEVRNEDGTINAVVPRAPLSVQDTR